MRYLVLYNQIIPSMDEKTAVFLDVFTLSAEQENLKFMLDVS